MVDARRATFLVAVLVLVSGVLLAACGSSDSSSTGSTAAGDQSAEAGGDEGGSSGGTAKLETGGGPEVEVPAEGLDIGLFMIAESNLYQQQVVKGAEAAAAKYGAKVTDYDGEFEPTVQIAQIENAMQKGETNAVMMIPTSGELLCNLAAKQLPEEGVAVVILAVPVCGHAVATGEESAEPGTLAYVGSVSTKEYVLGWLEAVAKENPGEHTIAVVEGPEIVGAAKALDAVLKEWEPKHPDLHVKYKAYTNYTTPDALAKTQALLKAHSDIDLIMSVYSPDLTQGVITALEEEGKAGDIPVDTLGGSKYDYEQIEKGNIQFTIPLFPYNIGYQGVKALAEAGEGKQPPRYIDDSTVGSAVEPFVITKDNLSEFEPQY